MKEQEGDDGCNDNADDDDDAERQEGKGVHTQGREIREATLRDEFSSLSLFFPPLLIITGIRSSPSLSPLSLIVIIIMRSDMIKGRREPCIMLFLSSSSRKPSLVLLSFLPCVFILLLAYVAYARMSRMTRTSERIEERKRQPAI